VQGRSLKIKSMKLTSIKNMAINYQIVRNKNAKVAVLQQFGVLKDSNIEVHVLLY